MTRRVTIIGAVLLVLVVAALLISSIPQARLKANRIASQNNLREISLFAAQVVKPDPNAKRDPSKLPVDVPPGTIVLPDVPPDLRLSWVVGVLPGLDQKRQNTAELFARIDQ